MSFDHRSVMLFFVRFGNLTLEIPVYESRIRDSERLVETQIVFGVKNYFQVPICSRMIKNTQIHPGKLFLGPKLVPRLRFYKSKIFTPKNDLKMTILGSVAEFYLKKSSRTPPKKQFCGILYTSGHQAVLLDHSKTNFFRRYNFWRVLPSHPSL